MIAQWCGDLISKMHTNRITRTMLAAELGNTREYVSMVLNGHRTPKDAEEKFTAAVDALIAKAARTEAT
jgi:hypothetical protein